MLDLDITDLTGAAKLLHSKTSLQTLKAMISIGDPGSRFPSGFRNVRIICRLEFEDDDIIEAKKPHNLCPPKEEHIERLISFAESIKDKTNGRLLIHCFAGQCRSTAAGFIVNCVWLGPGKEEEAMHRTLQACRKKEICPNDLMIQYADRLLGRDGVMMDQYIQHFTSGPYRQ